MCTVMEHVPAISADVRSVLPAWLWNMRISQPVDIPA